jgi:hypothetical protein
LGGPVMRQPRSQRGMPVAPLPLPRGRGDMESADRMRTITWRIIAGYAVLYIAGAAGIIWIALS